MVPVKQLTAHLETQSNTNLDDGTSATAGGSNTLAGASIGPGESDTNTASSAALLRADTATIAPEVLADQRLKAARKSVARYIHQFVQNTYSGALGVTGMIFLLITAILTLSRIEDAFNDIWGVNRGRDWMVRVVNYFTAIIGGPILLVAALGLAGERYFIRTRAMITGLPLIEPIMAHVLPWMVICLAFAMFYKLVPNTKVHLGAALVGGTLAGTLWHFYNLLGFLFVSRAVSASKIYGSLALVPLFMGGLYVVWLTVLFGAQVAYAFQNRSHYLQDKLAENVNQRGREFIALRLMTCVGRNFQRGLPPADVGEISEELGIPSRLVQQVLHTLLAARLVVEVAGREMAYAPARPLETINAHHVLLAMRTAIGQDAIARGEPMREEVYGEYARIQEAEKAAASAITLRALVDRAQARLEIPPGEPTQPSPV
jgi:membrane protein